MKKKLCAAALAATIGIGCMAGAPVSQAATRAELAKISVNQKGSNFQYWNKESAPYRALTNYVKDVTDPKSKNFIPVEDRIAVFDLDGTLTCETTPSYFEWMLYLERVLNDPSYTPSAEEKA
ncbi:MAG: haloacid dehalogenase-like hydrolase, partial [Selenomonadaceae bacterium]|nr:haloacid dehalogenase-like hydrolase [Selenomonadaceae bacterium]